jgi:hypothetical protein
MEPLAKPAIAAVKNGALRFRPERWTKVYLDWLENVHDWCISRQLWWGHQIPVWYDEDGVPVASREDLAVGAPHPTTGKPTWKNYYPGSVNITSGKIVADVLDDPSQLFIVQADEDIEQADIGKNADVVGTGGSTTTGVSTMELDSSTIADTAALNLKIVGLWNVPGNALGDFAVVVVKINEHLYGSTGVKAVT